MSTMGWAILGAANAPVYFALGWLFFTDWENFWDAVGLWLTPDIVSMFSGDYYEGMWARTKLALWVVLCAACVFGEAQLIGKAMG